VRTENVCRRPGQLIEVHKEITLMSGQGLGVGVRQVGQSFKVRVWQRFETKWAIGIVSPSHRCGWGPSPIRAKTYGKDGRREPFAPRSSAKSPHFQASPLNAEDCI
jgi:hypothetical protein